MCFEQRVMFLWLISVLSKLCVQLNVCFGKWAFSVVLSDSVSIKHDALICFWLSKEKEGGGGKRLLLAAKQPYLISTSLFKMILLNA